MYKLRFTRWGFVKYNRELNMAFLVRKKRARNDEGKSSTFFVHRKEVAVQAARSTALSKRRRPSSPSPVTPNSLVAQHGYRRLRAFAQSQSVPCVVTTPDVLRGPEILFADIQTYVQCSISTGAWYVDSNGYLQSLQRGSVDASEFAHLCYEATKLFTRSSAAQGRRLLSKAFSLLQTLVKEEDPWLLQNLMSTMIRLKQNGHTKICAILQNYIVELATIILREKPLWRRICISICYSDPDHTELLTRSWRSLTNAFADLPGVNGRLIHMRVMNAAELTYRLYRSTEPERAERLLRGILAEYEQKMQMMDDTAMYVIIRLADVLLALRRYTDVELLLEDVLLRAREAGLLSTTREADFMELLAQAQHRLFKYDLAEESIRKSIALYADSCVRNDPCIIGCSRDLENWLLGWGRDAEADQLSAEIDQMIGPDDIDIDIDARVPPHYPAKMMTSRHPNQSFQRDLTP